MSMSSSVLASELLAVQPEALEPDAIENLAEAFANYCKDAAALTPILAPAIATAKTAFIGAASGLSNSGAGAGKIVAAIQAFWTSIAAGGTSSFAGATAISPAFSSLSAGAISPVFTANIDGALSQSAATSALALAIHATRTGGTVTTAGPVVTPIA